MVNIQCTCIEDSFSVPLKYIFHRSTGNETLGLYKFCGAICHLSKKMFLKYFASYMPQYRHINPHFITQHKTFHVNFSTVLFDSSWLITAIYNNEIMARSLLR